MVHPAKSIFSAKFCSIISIVFNRVNERVVKYGVVRSVQEENRFYERLTSSVGLRYTPPDTSKQEDALIAAKIAKVLEQDGMYVDYIPDVCLALNVSRSTFYKYFSMIREKDDVSIRDVDFIHCCGKPRIFPLKLTLH